MVDNPPAKILLVDDTEANRYAWRRFLESSGHSILEAGTGTDGMELAQQQQPDLIILDVNLPDLDGFAVCRQLKGDAKTARIPIIQVSASFVRTQEQIKGLEGGADAYLTQPIEPSVLVATVNAVLRAHRTERELRETQARLRAALEAAGMETFNIDCNTHRVQRFIEPRSSNEKMNAIDQRLEEFVRVVHPADQVAFVERIESAMAGEKRYESEYRVLREGEIRWRLERGHLVKDSLDRPSRIIGVSLDVTERKKMEEALTEADQRKDEFLAMLAHELRNPLSPIRNAAKVLDHVSFTDTRSREMLSVIHRQVNHMARLVDDLLDVSRITSGKIELQRQFVPLAAVIDYAVETNRPSLESRQHTLIVEPAGEQLWIKGDQARLSQAISNIVSNAAKYTERGGRIVLSVTREGDYAVVRVRDNGIGISEALLPNVFDLFMQGDRTLDRAQGGLGIGLALVKKLVELHAGTVEARSDGIGKGSEFIVRLPIAASQVQSAAAPDRAEAQDVEHRRILIVDDNRDSAESMAAFLRLSCHSVQTAHVGSDALSVAPAFKPDVVFLDIGLPGMSGLELVKRLREAPELSHTRFIALTGYGQPSDRQRSLEAGFHQHLVKPLDPSLLEDILRLH